MSVLVTGATGFVGSHIVDALLGEEYHVACLVRKSSDISRLRNVKINYGDLSTPNGLKGLTEDCSVIVHSAGVVLPKDPMDFWKMNVQGTKNLLTEIVNCRSTPPLIIHISTATVTGSYKSHGALNENSACKPETPYEKSKYESELVCQQVAQEYGLPITFVRPCKIYGPRDSHTDIRKTSWLVSKGIKPVFGKRNLPMDMVYVKNLAYGIVKLIREHIIGKTFIISDDDCLTVGRFVDEIASCLGVSGHEIRIPMWLMRFYSRKTKAFRYILNEVRYSNSKAKDELGYKPKYDMTTALNETLLSFGLPVRPFPPPPDFG